MNVRVGSTNNDRGGQVVSLSRAIYHRKFNSKEMDYDVSLLFLSETLKIDNFLIATVAIAPQDSVVPDNALAVTSGWGSLQVKKKTFYMRVFSHEFFHFYPAFYNAV